MRRLRNIILLFCALAVLVCLLPRAAAAPTEAVRIDAAAAPNTSQVVVAMTTQEFLVQNLVVLLLTCLAVVVIFLILLLRSRAARRKAQEVMDHSSMLLNALERKQYELLKSQQELEKALGRANTANEAKTSFLSRMSHDIRTPLNGIIGLLAVSDRHSDDIELMKANHQKMKIAADHLLSLINDVLDMSKLEDGSVELTEEPFDLFALCSDVVTICSIRAQENGITVTYDDGAGIQYPHVYGSPLHVRQILMNLLSNAVKYNRPGGSIYCGVQVRSAGNASVVYDFTIRDTGIGISQEFLEHLYEPFTQERSDARSRYQGTGLGMAIVKALIDKMHGHIHAESQVGKGTTFVVTLPFRVQTEVNSPSAPQKPVSADISGMHLLVVEDNALNQEIAQMILEDAGATVVLAENGKKAVEAFRDSAPGTYDAILMDIMMPEMDGYEATRCIRSLPNADAAAIPIIAMTANAFVDDVRKAKLAGMNEHLAKPLVVDKLLQTLAAYRR